nr:hypothetical protein Iba_scaffold10265CG0060 [Ipomoea batatas]
MAPTRVLAEAPIETIPEQGLNRGQGRVGARIGQASARLGRAGAPVAYSPTSSMVSRRCNFSKVGETVPTGGVVSPSLMRSRETKRRSRRCLGIPHLKCLGPARRLLDPQTRLENLLPKGRRHYPHGGEWHRYHIASRTGRPRMHPLGNLEVVGSKEVPCRKLEKEPRTPA